MPRPCGHKEQHKRGEPYIEGCCRICWLFFNNKKYRDIWSEGEDIIGGEEVVALATPKKDCGCKNKKRDIGQRRFI